MANAMWCNLNGFLGIIIRINKGRADVLTVRTDATGEKVVTRNNGVSLDRLGSSGKVDMYKKEIRDMLTQAKANEYFKMKQARKEANNRRKEQAA